MQIAVVGGGVVGVCTAYFLAAAGHQTVVLERYSNVALETSFGNAGLMAPSACSAVGRARHAAEAAVLPVQAGVARRAQAQA